MEPFLQMKVNTPTIAFDCASGSVLCKSDGGGKHDDVSTLIERFKRRLTVSKSPVAFSEKPKATLADISMRANGGGERQPVRVMLRRARVHSRLDLDRDCERRQSAGDFVPLCIDNVSGRSVSAMLCAIDRISQDGSDKQMQRRYTKYWRGSIDVVNPDAPPLARFVVIRDIPAADLKHAAEAGTLIDIQMKLEGIIYYDRYSALAWSIEMIRGYEGDEEDEDDDDEKYDEDEDEDEDGLVESVPEVATRSSKEDAQELDLSSSLAQSENLGKDGSESSRMALVRERRELLFNLRHEEDLSEDEIDSMNDRLTFVNGEIKRLRAAV